MTKEQLMAAIRQYGAYRGSDLTDDAARKLEEIALAVEQNWPVDERAKSTVHDVPLPWILPGTGVPVLPAAVQDEEI